MSSDRETTLQEIHPTVRESLSGLEMAAGAIQRGDCTPQEGGEAVLAWVAHIRTALASTPPTSNPWKDAVIDLAVVDCIYRAEHENDPRQCLADIVSWEQQIALDPAVSKAARDLIEQGRQSPASVPVEPSGWQPIATAPKNHPIWLIEAGEPLGVRIPHQFQGFWRVDDQYAAGGYWCEVGDEIGVAHPHSWMPLPSPPLSLSEDTSHD